VGIYRYSPVETSWFRMGWWWLWWCCTRRTDRTRSVQAATVWYGASGRMVRRTRRRAVYIPRGTVVVGARPMSLPLRRQRRRRVASDRLLLLLLLLFLSPGAAATIVARSLVPSRTHRPRRQPPSRSTACSLARLPSYGPSTSMMPPPPPSRSPAGQRLRPAAVT